MEWSACQAQALHLLAQAQGKKRRRRERVSLLGQAAQLPDQFFALHMPALLQKAATGGIDARPSIDHIVDDCTALLDQIGECWVNELMPALAADDICIMTPETLSPDQQAWLSDYYQHQIFPLLIPQAVDASRPFPYIPGGALTLLAQLQELFSAGKGDAHLFVTITIPSTTPRLIPLPVDETRTWTYVWCEDVVRHFAHTLFPGLTVLSVHLFRVLRAHVGDDQGGQSGKTANVTAPVARLDVEQTMPPPLLDWLIRHLHQPDSVIMRRHSPLAQADFVEIAAQLPERRNWLLSWLYRLFERITGGRKR
jgi:polyphosphate kinase